MIASMHASADRRVYRAFKDAGAYMDDIFELYQALYSLPLLDHTCHLEDASLYEYCSTRKYFVNIVPYTKNQQVLLSPTFGEKDLYWRIIGGAVGASFDDSFVAVAQRHVARYVKNVDLGEIEPVALLKNTFTFGDRAHSHLGILFIGRVRNYDDRGLTDSLSSSRGHFVPFSVQGSAPRAGEIYQQKALELAIERALEALSFVNQDSEIEANATYRGRYAVHSALIKPIMKLASRIWGQHSIKDLENRIEEEILKEKPISVLDVACGENQNLVSMVKEQKIPLFVGNDISWSQVELITKTFSADTFRNITGLAFFTNHDGRRLPFSNEAFDIAICKNVLHHMPDRRSVISLLDEVKRVSKRALIIEVMDPKFENRWGRIRHRYYMDFLKDAGGNFLSGAEFDGLLSRHDLRSRFDMKTFRGIYQFAII